jgi:hypothetical protein
MPSAVAPWPPPQLMGRGEGLRGHIARASHPLARGKCTHAPKPAPQPTPQSLTRACQPRICHRPKLERPGRHCWHVESRPCRPKQKAEGSRLGRGRLARRSKARESLRRLVKTACARPEFDGSAGPGHDAPALRRRRSCNACGTAPRPSCRCRSHVSRGFRVGGVTPLLSLLLVRLALGWASCLEHCARQRALA